MVFQGSLGVEETVAAAVPCSQVDIHVSLQGVRAIEGFVTVFTFISPLVLVAALVPLIQTEIFEGFITGFTLVHFHFGQILWSKIL